jgi:3-phenylpropionate/trans-cinnamate dioxygenase ferredoxin reductase component
VSTVLIIGSGQAGTQVAVSLRDKGYPGRVVLVGDEPGIPYQRPPLSKAYLTEGWPNVKLALRPMSFYARYGIELVAGRAVRLDRDRHQVRLGCGRELEYAHLVLATGTRNRQLTVPGARLEGILGLRTREDADRLRARLGTARDIVVIGGGFIGLEFAASVAKLGLTVTVVELATRVMARAVSPVVSGHYETMHQRHGNRVLRGVAVAGFHGSRRGEDRGHVGAVELTDGTTLPADLVVVGVGVLPNCELAAEAGLAVDNGIVVDEHLSTADPDISAIGDCAAHPNRHAGGRLRLESVQNALDHARCVAARLTGGAQPYTSLPWFWSDQFDARLQIAGIADGVDEAVVHGDPGSGAFSVLRFREERLVAVESVNRVPDHVAARRLLDRPAHPVDRSGVLAALGREAPSERGGGRKVHLAAVEADRRFAPALSARAPADS